MITEKTVKYTKTNQAMAFLTLEDLVGTVEIIVFPRDFERYHAKLEQDARIFVKGHASVEEDRNGKIICEKIVSFDETRRELWLQFENMERYEGIQPQLEELFLESDGTDSIVIYLAAEKRIKRLPAAKNIRADADLLEELSALIGKNNVKLVEKSLESIAK